MPTPTPTPPPNSPTPAGPPRAPNAGLAAPSPQDVARARQVELVLERIDALPTLPTVAARLMQMGAAADTNADEIATLVESDPALAARILGLCRRADKGLGDRITTVKRAIVMLGMEAVRAAALSVTIYDLVTREQQEHSAKLDKAVSESAGLVWGSEATRGFDRGGFWKHCIGVACASEEIARAQTQLRVVPEEAFLAGLLHGIGRIALDFVLPRSYSRVVELAEKRQWPSSLAERQLLGLDHHTAGKRLATHWRLPASLQEVIWLHDQALDAPGRLKAPALIGIVTTARAMCREMHVGFSGDFGPLPAPLASWRAMGLSGDPMELAARLHEATAARMATLGLTDTTTPRLLLESLASATRQLSRLNTQLLERARHGDRQQRALESVHAFNLAVAHASSLTDTLGAVGRSASGCWGASYLAALVRTGHDAPWQLFEFDQGGRAVGVRDLEPPGTLMGELSASNLGAGGQLTLTSMALLGWLGDYLTMAPDLRALRLVPLAPLPAEVGLSALLIADRVPETEGIHAQEMRTLVGSWATALSASAQREQAQRLGERLVESARELEAARGKLAEREGLAKLGETTAGAAHEINNPLTVIAGRAQLLLKHLKDDRDRAAVGAITTAARQIGELVKSLHLLSSQPVPAPSAYETKELVRAAIAQARARVAADCVPTIDTDGAPPAIWIDGDLFSGALSELVANALEASPEGPIAIVAEYDPLLRQLEVQVLDSGPGFTEKALRHACDPFFSEKPAGRGRGLGLTRARVMAEALGGELSLRNAQPPESAPPPPPVARPRPGTPPSVVRASVPEKPPTSGAVVALIVRDVRAVSPETVPTSAA